MVGAVHRPIQLGAFALGDVFLDRDEMGDDALFIAHRRNHFRLPEEFAILFAVQQLAAPLPPKYGPASGGFKRSLPDCTMRWF
jgi:hypothetical protein